MVSQKVIVYSCPCMWQATPLTKVARKLQIIAQDFQVCFGWRYFCRTLLRSTSDLCACVCVVCGDTGALCTRRVAASPRPGQTQIEAQAQGEGLPHMPQLVAFLERHPSSPSSNTLVIRDLDSESASQKSREGGTEAGSKVRSSAMHAALAFLLGHPSLN